MFRLITPTSREGSRDSWARTFCRTVRGSAVALIAGGLVSLPLSAHGQDTAVAPPPPPVEDEAVKVLTAEEIPAEVQEALNPLFERVQSAERLRATINMEVVSAIGDDVLGSNKGVFQAASQVPNLLILSAKFDNDAVRLVSSGERLFIQISKDEYVETDAPASLNSFIAAMPLQLGPQPEPMLWLSVAGMEPGKLLLEGVESISSKAGDASGGKATSVITAVRPEGVKWDLTVTTGNEPQPVSMTIDITKMITQSNNVEVPEGYSFKIKYDFERWEINPAIDPQLFAFTPGPDAKKYDSIADYLEAKNSVDEHPLLGKPAPTFTAKSLADETVELTDQPGEVVVLDFWATWCGPCVQALPEISKLMKEFEGKGVRFHAVSVAEPAEDVSNFLKEKELTGLPVVLDPNGEVASAYAATAIPQTVLIGKDGRVEAVHVGFDPAESIELLRREIGILLEGRRIHLAEEIEDSDDATTEEPPAPESSDN